MPNRHLQILTTRPGMSHHTRGFSIKIIFSVLLYISYVSWLWFGGLLMPSPSMPFTGDLGLFRTTLSHWHCQLFEHWDNSSIINRVRLEDLRDARCTYIHLFVLILCLDLRAVLIITTTSLIVRVLHNSGKLGCDDRNHYYSFRNLHF